MLDASDDAQRPQSRDRIADRGLGASTGTTRDAIDPSPAVRVLARDLATYEARSELVTSQYHARLETSTARSRVAQVDAAAEHAMLAEVKFLRGLGAVYRDPEAARRAFLSLMADRGVDRAAEVLRDHPARLGALVTVRRTVAFGLWHREDSSPARAAAPRAADWGREAVEAERQMRAVAATVRTQRLETDFGEELRAVHRFSAALEGMYRDPAAAHLAFERLAAARGAEHAADVLRQHPWLFGQLREPDVPHQAPRAASLGVEAARALSELPPVEARLARESGTLRGAVGVGTERTAALAAVDRAVRRETVLAHELARLPDGGALERGIASAMRQLTPVEFRQLRQIVTAPQLALASRLRETVKETLLGRDGPER